MVLSRLVICPALLMGLGFALALPVRAADSTLPAEQCPAHSLCTELGGATGLSAISDALIDRSFQDPRTRDHWNRVDAKRVKTKLAEYLCVLTGGTCPYDDDDMKTIHAGQHIRSAEFYALVENLRDVLAERGVSEGAKNRLLGLLASSKRDVVEP